MTFANNTDLRSILFYNKYQFLLKTFFFAWNDLNSEDIEICHFYKLSKNFWRALYITLLTLSPLAVNFEDCWWPLQTIWIQMKPHKMWGFIWDPNYLTFRLYIGKKYGRKWRFFANFEEKIFENKMIPSMQRVKAGDRLMQNKSDAEELPGSLLHCIK